MPGNHIAASSLPHTNLFILFTTIGRQLFSKENSLLVICPEISHEF
jgi:hypothetical protein